MIVSSRASSKDLEYLIFKIINFKTLLEESQTARMMI